MFVDTHCHLYKEYYDDILEIIKEAEKDNVNYFIVDGCDDKSNKEVLNLVKFSNIYGTLGIHPENVEKYRNEDLVFLEENLTNKKIIAIGEIGLDYHYSKDNKEQQKELFRKQLELAQKYKMPVVIHSRDATEDTINILKEFPLVKGVIHSFSGSLETALIYIKMGYKLGINGVVTFKNCNLKDILKNIINSIILETDSPYLTPHPYRGTKNAPKYIKNIALFICENTDLSINELAKITNDNVRSVFDIQI